MKQMHILFMGMLLLCLNSSAFAQIDTNKIFASQMNAVFANLEKNRVPYGILRDYGMEFTNLELFKGTAPLADSNATTPSNFWEVYNTLYMSRIYGSASGFVRPDTLDNRWSAYRQYGRITLTGLYFAYSRFKDNAAGNYVTVSNNQLFDKYVNGVWQNPYQTEQAFTLSPSVTDYEGLSLFKRCFRQASGSPTTLPQ